jgi:hypothetical protein
MLLLVTNLQGFAKTRTVPEENLYILTAVNSAALA